MRFSLIVALAACLIAAGCATSKTSGGNDVSLERVKYWQPYLLYLHAAPCARLYVEIDAVAGCEPSQAAVDKLREFLTTYCKKPGGIEIVRSDVIPLEEARGIPRYGLAHRYLNGPPQKAGEASPAFMYLLFYDGACCEQTTAAKSGGGRAPKLESQRNFPPYTEVLSYPAAVFMNDRYVPSVMKEEALLHEAGHLLGLVRRPDSHSTWHCPDTSCRMVEAFHLRQIYMDRMRGMFGSKSGKHFQQLCTNCVAELEANLAAKTPTNVRFVGPVLVRSEAGYHVLNLPGRVRLIVGDLSEQDCRDFAAAAHLNPPATNNLYSDGQVKPELLTDETKALEIIQRARKDPFDTVRTLAARFVEQ